MFSSPVSKHTSRKSSSTYATPPPSSPASPLPQPSSLTVEYPVSARRANSGGYSHNSTGGYHRTQPQHNSNYNQQRNQQVPSAAVPSHQNSSSSRSANPKKPHSSAFGPYTLGKTLGEGEFGKVKLGQHMDTRKEVAVKLIKKASIDSPARREKLIREISLLKSVSHPHIVRLHEVIETEHYIGMIMDYASGGELFGYILKRRYLKEKEASAFFAQLISGVSYLHKNLIVHRDLKLENLLIDSHRNIVITDFGFANTFNSDSSKLLQTSCGSPCYAAPELVISDGYVGEAADIWSCGVILYAMVCGYLPYDDDPANPEGDNINLLYKYILETKPDYPEYVSETARDLISMILVPDPRYRANMSQIINHKWLRSYAYMLDISSNGHTIASETIPVQKVRETPPQQQIQPSSPTASPSQSPLSKASSGLYISPQSSVSHNTNQETLQSVLLFPPRLESMTSLESPEPLVSAVPKNTHQPSVLDIVQKRQRQDHTHETIAVESVPDIASDGVIHQIDAGMDANETNVNSTLITTLPTAESLSVNNADAPVAEVVAKHDSPTRESNSVDDNMESGQAFNTKPFSESLTPKPSVQTIEQTAFAETSAYVTQKVMSSQTTAYATPISPTKMTSGSDSVASISTIPKNEHSSSPVSLVDSSIDIAVTPDGSIDIAAVSDEPIIIDKDFNSDINKPVPAKPHINLSHVVDASNHSGKSQSFDIPRETPSSIIIRKTPYLEPLSPVVIDNAPSDEQSPTARKLVQFTVADESTRTSLPAPFSNRGKSFDSRRLTQAERDIESGASVGKSRQPSFLNQRVGAANQDGNDESHGYAGLSAVPRASISSQYTTNPGSDYSRLKIHSGPIDQRALSSKPPRELISDISVVLGRLGMEVYRVDGEDYKLRVVRPKGGVPTQSHNFRPDLPHQSSNDAIENTVFTGVAVAIQTDMPSNETLPVAFVSPKGSKEMKRGSSINIVGGENKTKHGTSNSNGSGSAARIANVIASFPMSLVRRFRYLAQFGPRYDKGFDGHTQPDSIPPAGLPSISSKSTSTADDIGEVRFYISLHRIKNLPGLAVVDFKRLRGDIWQFKRLYNEIIPRLSLQEQTFGLL
ncbi:hypothetical protein QVD99_007383 [Batrachochytrium dendrobatidis]|nr:hypothetical protein QVD99_007383 [Batrachochytrium dendrobatidis]